LGDGEKLITGKRGGTAEIVDLTNRGILGKLQGEKKAKGGAKRENNIVNKPYRSIVVKKSIQ